MQAKVEVIPTPIDGLPSFEKTTDINMAKLESL